MVAWGFELVENQKLPTRDMELGGHVIVLACQSRFIRVCST